LRAQAEGKKSRQRNPKNIRRNLNSASSKNGEEPRNEHRRGGQEGGSIEGVREMEKKD